MKTSLATVAAAAFLAATAIAYAGPADDTEQNQTPQAPALPQAPAERAMSNTKGGVLQAPSASPNRETTGAATPMGAPRDPVPAGGKHPETEDAPAPRAK